MSTSRCPLCTRDNIPLTPLIEIAANYFDCPICGPFSITPEATSQISGNGWIISAYVHRQRQSSNSPLIVASNVSQSKASIESRGAVVVIGEILRNFPHEIENRLDEAMLNLVSETSYPGKEVTLDRQFSNPILLSRDPTESAFIHKSLIELDFISEAGPWPTHWKVLVRAKGFKRVSDLKRGQFASNSKQVFVAMSFDKSLDSVFELGIQPAVDDCGFKAVRIDLTEHNEKICDAIISEIRRSRFLVADFTGHRGGVYFEAGLMMGIGRPVVFTCRDSDLENAHFDTRQYNHINWSSPEDLRKRLRQRILATIEGAVAKSTG